MFFYFLACVWKRILFLTSIILSTLSPSFLHSSHWCHFPVVSVPLLCSPLLQLCLSSLSSTPCVPPAAEFKEGKSVPCGCTLREGLPVARWSKSNLRGTEGVLNTGQDFKGRILQSKALLCIVTVQSLSWCHVLWSTWTGQGCGVQNSC